MATWEVWLESGPPLYWAETPDLPIYGSESAGFLSLLISLSPSPYTDIVAGWDLGFWGFGVLGFRVSGFGV